jgi:hypothetical protein
MTVRIRAKFRCVSETKHFYGDPAARTLRFDAIYSPDIPEDQRYAKATPTGTLEMRVDNPSAQFTVGAFYYLDFVPVDAELTVQQ